MCVGYWTDLWVVGYAFGYWGCVSSKGLWVLGVDECILK